jgi:hypothetical protein
MVAPITVTIDAATTIAVVGGAVFLIAHTPGNVAVAEAERERRENINAVSKTLDDLRRQERKMSINALE